MINVRATRLGNLRLIWQVDFCEGARPDAVAEPAVGREEKRFSEMRNLTTLRNGHDFAIRREANPTSHAKPNGTVPGAKCPGPAVSHRDADIAATVIFTILGTIYVETGAFRALIGSLWLMQSPPVPGSTSRAIPQTAARAGICVSFPPRRTTPAIHEPSKRW